MPKRADIVAERTLYRQLEGGRWQPVRITFEKPRKQPSGEWGCRYTLHDFEQSAWEVSKLVFGVDAVQALGLAQGIVDRILMHSKAFAEGRLSWSPDSAPHRLGTFPGPSPNLGLFRKGRPIAMSELVRTVELELDWPLPCVLRVEVLVKRYGKEAEFYWTRVWRSDSYRLQPTASAAVRGRKRKAADEIVLVEDSMAGEMGRVVSGTPEDALEATLTKIRWQLFADTQAENAAVRTNEKPRRKNTKRR